MSGQPKYVSRIVDDTIAEKNLTCPECGKLAEWFRDWTLVSPMSNDLTHDEIDREGWSCEDCGWNQDATEDDFKRLTQYNLSFAANILTVKTIVENCKPRRAQTIAELFDDAPDGDFTWDQEYNDEENAGMCDGEWFTYFHQLQMGRENGARWVEVSYLDAHGDRDDLYDWKESSEFQTAVATARGEPDPQNFVIIGKHLANIGIQFHKGWIQYWLECAETGKDPLNQTSVKLAGEFVEHCVKNAENLAKSLTPTETQK